MSVLSRLTYYLEVKPNTVLQAFALDRRIENPEFQVDASLETSSAKIISRNRAAIKDLTHNLRSTG